MSPKALRTLAVLASASLAGCVAAVIGHAPNSGTAGDSRARAAVAPDAALVTAVRAKLNANAKLRIAPITVNAAGGTVLLSGSVANAAQRAAAERAARSVAGVVAVNNQLEVN
ncbi:MAG: BON domain-containing protein [Proteobacteria bacterium]|nr:BON domain-containing protein [Pseudomonadota bacterium]